MPSVCVEELKVAKSSVEELESFERTFFHYPEAAEIMKQIRSLHVHGIGADSAYCMLVVGESGAGKSALVREYLKGYPEVRGSEADQIPVLVVKIRMGATPKSVAEEILMALGDPVPSKGTLASRMLRIQERVRKLGVQLLILDEFQSLVERRGARERIAYEIADWVKSLLNARLCPIVLVGTGDAELVVKSNPQLRRRCRTISRLDAVNFKTKIGRSLVYRLLETSKGELPFGLTAELDMDIAQRIHYAADGFVGRVFELLHAACYYAFENGLPRVDPAVFDAVLIKAGIDDGKVNPFRGVTPHVVQLQNPDLTPRTRFRKREREPSLDSVVRA